MVSILYLVIVDYGEVVSLQLQSKVSRLESDLGIKQRSYGTFQKTTTT